MKERDKGMVSFLNSVLSYLLLVLVCVTVAGAGFGVGLLLRKKKNQSNAKKAQEAVKKEDEQV